MKIIKKGKRPEDKKHRGTCHNCKTVVEFSQSEGVVTYDQRDGNFVTVKCPTCGQDITSAINPPQRFDPHDR